MLCRQDSPHPYQTFFKHVARTSISSILAIVYGQRVMSSSSPFLEYHHRVIHAFEQMLGLRGIPVTALIPWIENYLPDSIASWRIRAREIKSNQLSLFSNLLEECQKQLENGEFTGCHMQQVLQRKDEFGFKNMETIA
jgi:hypothetical protein